MAVLAHDYIVYKGGLLLVLYVRDITRQLYPR